MFTDRSDSQSSLPPHKYVSFVPACCPVNKMGISMRWTKPSTHHHQFGNQLETLLLLQVSMSLVVASAIGGARVEHQDRESIHPECRISPLVLLGSGPWTNGSKSRGNMRGSLICQH